MKVIVLGMTFISEKLFPHPFFINLLKNISHKVLIGKILSLLSGVFNSLIMVNLPGEVQSQRNKYTSYVILLTGFINPLPKMAIYHK